MAVRVATSDDIPALERLWREFELEVPPPRHLDHDPERVVQGREAFRDWMQELADRTLDAMAGVHFDIPDPIRRIECMLAPTNDGGIYYTGPSEDFERPGRMWWSVPDGIDDFHPWREVTTVYH